MDAMSNESVYFESDGLLHVNATAFQSAGMRRFHIIVTRVNDVNWNTVDVVVEKLMPIDTLYDSEAVREAIRMFDAALALEAQNE